MRSSIQSQPQVHPCLLAAMDSDDSDGETESLFSLTPSLSQHLYRYSADRTFQSLNTYYFLPVDFGARQAEDLHFRFSQALFDGKLYREPAGQEGWIPGLLSREGGRVLDIGCGVLGAWVAGMAEQFPRAQCVGVDLVPVEAKYAPPNCYFEVWDVTEGLPYPDGYFSVIHTGLITPFVPDFPRLISEMQRCLKPGGVLLLDECEAALHRLPSSTKYDFLLLAQQSTQRGLSLPFATRPHFLVPFHDIPRAVSEAVTKVGSGRVPAFDFVHEMTTGIPVGAQNWMNPKEALISSTKQQFFLILWDLLQLDPANQTGEAQKMLATLRRITLEGGRSREEGPVCPYTSVWARKTGGAIRV